MKILITRSSEMQTIGGAELSARDQCRVLKQLGHQPVMMTNNTRLRRGLGDKGIASIRGWYIQNYTPPLRHILFWLGLPLKLVWDVAATLIIRPDVINPHTREDQITLTLTKFIHRRPVVWKDPGDMVFVLTRKHGLLGGIYKRLYLAAAHRADHIYMLNDEHVQQLGQALGSTDKISAIPSSILYEDYSPTNREPSDSLVFGSISRLTPEKDIATLVRAFLQISTSVPEAKLLIYGDGPQKRTLQEMAEGYDSITFAGWSDDVSTSLNTIDIFVHPAIAEGWGRNIKEAMYFGKPIIGSRVGGIAKQIEDGETGLLFEPGNIEELADKMLILANDSNLREQLAANAHQKALNDGDFVRVVEEQILPIYRAATSGK